MTELYPWLRLLDRRRGRLLLGALLVFATLASAVGLLALSGWFITATGVTALLWAAGARQPFDVYLPGGGIRFFALTRTLTRYAERLYNHDSVLRLLADLRSTHFAALTRLDGVTLGRWRSAQWLNRLTADIDTLDTLYLRLLAPPAAALLGILLVSGLIALHQPALAGLLLVGLLLLLGLLTLGLARWGQALAARRVALLDELRLQTIEQLQGMAELDAAGVLGAHQLRLLQGSSVMLGAQQRLQWRIALGQGLANAGVLVAGLVVLLVCLQAVSSGNLPGPVAVMLTLAMLALGEGFASLPAGFGQYGATRGAAARLNEQQALRSRLPEVDRAVSLPLDNSLHWDGATVGHAAIQGLELRVGAGESVALVGPSGCGKSTLADLLARLLDPDEGAVRIGGVDLRTLSLESLRGQLGYLTQGTDLLHDSIAANLRLGNPHATDEQLWDALEIVGLADLIESLPDGLATWVGELGRQLSGGEARRLALARVVLKDAPVVVLDEPFTGLDRNTRELVRLRLEGWLEGRTAVFLGHDPSALPRADRVLRWRDLPCRAA